MQRHSRTSGCSLTRSINHSLHVSGPSGIIGLWLKLAEADGLGLENVTPKYIVDHLHNDNYNRAGVLGRLVKVEGSDEKVFRAWESWTPARALDYLRRASACHFRELMK